MFTWFRNFPLERRMDHLANTVAQYKEAVQLLKEQIVAEREEVRQGISDEVASAIAPLQTEIDDLKFKVEELATRPEGTVDISEVLADFDVLKQHLGEIYVAPTKDTSAPVVDLPIDETDDEEFDDMPTVILDQGPTEEEKQQQTEAIQSESDAPAADVIVSIPDHSSRPENEVKGMVFDDPV